MEVAGDVGKISKAEILREIITEKLSTAAREILAVVERTVVGYEEEAAVLRMEMEQQRRQLEVLQPRVKLELLDAQFPVCEPPVGGAAEFPEEDQEHKYEPRNMLLKAKLGEVQKYVRLTEPTLKEFLTAAFAKFGVPPVTEGVTVVDGSGTEVDNDVFEDVARDPSTGVLVIQYDTESVSMVTSPLQCQSSVPDSSDSYNAVVTSEGPSRKRQRLDKEAKQLVESVLSKQPGGERIVNEYKRTRSLVDESRRKMVNILAAHMTEKNGTSPPRHVKEMYARGIVTLFPHLSDPYSKNGYEHYYDGDSGTGYLAWRIKTIQRSTAKDRRSSFEEDVKQVHSRRSNLNPWEPAKREMCGGPTSRRESEFVPETVLSAEEWEEALSLMQHSADKDMVRKMMKLTFVHRRNMVLDPQQSSNLLPVFPRFRDVTGLVEQDFTLMFGEAVSGKLLERWPTTFKKKIVQESRKLQSTSELEELLLAADPPEGWPGGAADSGWDTDLSSVLLLLHLIPPSAQGRRRPGKVSATQAEKHLVVFKKTGTNIQEYLDTTSTHPYLLAVGAKKNQIHQFFIVFQQVAVPCRSMSSLWAFDELFKAHFVFGTSYNNMLHNMFTFLQTTVYNIDVGRVKESPRVAEVRVRLLQ